jgi:hypothetical protein
MSKASRMYWACVQANGVAEMVPVPGAKPGWPEGGLIPDLLRQQITFIRGKPHGDQVRLRSKHAVSRQVVLPAFGGEKWATTGHGS